MNKSCAATVSRCAGPARTSALAREGFTLIELLVVVSIIALLISILMPALTSAREQAKAVVCLSNVRHTVLGFMLYAEDFRYIPGTYHQGPINLDWSGRNNDNYLSNPGGYAHPIEASVLKPYLNSVDKIFECPTAKREANSFFDYTVIIRFAGAKPGLKWRMSYPPNPAQPNLPRKWFASLPFLIEEDSKFYNQPVDDGSWASEDQFADRHRGRCHLGFLDSSAGAFESPKGPSRYVAEAGDLQAIDMKISDGQKTFSIDYSNANEFGWVNDPK